MTRSPYATTNNTKEKLAHEHFHATFFYATYFMIHKWTICIVLPRISYEKLEYVQDIFSYLP